MPMLGYKRGALCTTDIDKDHGKVPLSGALRVQTSLTHEAKVVILEPNTGFLFPDITGCDMVLYFRKLAQS